MRRASLRFVASFNPGIAHRISHRIFPAASNRARQGFSLIELLAAGGIVVMLATTLAGAGWNVYRASSLAISANNIRQLAAGGAAYLADNNYTFWKYRASDPARPGAVIWWFGVEPEPRPEGQRILRAEEGPLGAYIPAGLRPDPSFRFTGKPFKPKFKAGFLGVGYNVLLADSEAKAPRAWNGLGAPARYWDLENPARTVVFVTSAQVNTIQAPASPRNPMIEEFYGVDDREITVHFRHNGQAMAAFADGNVGFLPMNPATRDPRAPKANVGRLDRKYLR